MNLPQILSLLWLLVVLIAFAMNSLSTRSKSTPLLQIQKCSTIVVMAGLFAFTLLVQFIVSKVHGPAVPVTNDEFCYLLAGENYSQGKLTSPPPPYLKPFQSSGYLLNHAYYPKYQPAQGISLAIGIILGKPIYGVWLILSLGIALAYWALQGFFTKSTAFQAAFLLSTHPLVLLWGESFMGGGVPFLGGTLFWGGWIHFYYKNPNIKNAILSGIGLMILLFCRPFEGLVLLAVIIFSCLLLFRFQPLRFTLHRAFYFLGILSLFVFLILLSFSFS